MSRGVRFLEEAQADVEAGSRHYREIDPELGRRFTDRIVDSAYDLVDCPERCPEVRPGVRQLVLRQFPYLVLYVVEPEDVVVVAVVGSTRDPGFIDRLVSDRYSAP